MQKPSKITVDRRWLQMLIMHLEAAERTTRLVFNGKAKSRDLDMVLFDIQNVCTFIEDKMA